MNKVRLIYCFAALLLTQGAAVAQGYRVDWNSVNSGGAQMSGGGYRITCSAGQSAAGFASNTDRLHWIGFWSGGIPTPTLVTRASDVKLMQDGAFVSVVGKVATSIETDFSGFFYVEDENRTGGLRVAIPAGAVSGLLRGRTIVNAIGTTGTAANGERQISAALVVIVSDLTDALRPVAVNNSGLGGADLGAPPLGQIGVTNGAGANNVGLLVMTFGTVQEVGTGYMVISDGSLDPVRVSTVGLSNLPQVGDFVAVTGISSLYPSGGDTLRLILPRLRSDIWPP